MPPGRCATDERVAAVRATGLGDAPDPVFVRQADLVRRLLKVPVAWVTLVLPDRQLFPGVSGLDGAPDTPSLCRRLVAGGEPLIIPDTAADLPEPAWPHEEFASYAGMPLVDSGGCILGALAAVDTVPRLWNADDREILQDLAAACSTELQLRIQIGRTRAATTDAESARRAAEVQRQAAEQARQRSQLTSGITQAMTSTFDPAEALRRLARMVVPLLAEICIVDVVEAGDQVRQIAVIPSEQAPAEPEPMPQGPDAYARVLRGQNQLVRIPVESGEDSRARLLADLGARCAVTVGLRARNRVLGALTLGGSEPISEADLALLEELAGRAALALDNIRLYQLQRHAAESLQASMLTRLPEPAGLRLAARYAPASEGVDIGGDWYDAFCLPDDVTMVAVGDVAGHDLRAAGRMGQLRAMLRTLAYDRMDPPSVLLQRLDRALAGLGADTMATAVLAALEPAGESWRLRWSSAGHLPPVLLHADGTSETLTPSASQRSRLDTPSASQRSRLDGPLSADLMLGVEVDRPRHDREQSLQPGDTLLLYTDGVVETRDTPPEQGLVRLRHLAARSVPAGIEQLCDSVIADVADHGGNDDAALIAVQLASADGSAAARRR